MTAMEGVFPILVTPFDKQGRIDEDSLRALIDFNVQADVHGLGIALGSEVFKLTEAERSRMTRLTVEQVAGRVPVVINSGAQGTDLAVHYSRQAAEDGADALMVMPPNFMPAGPDEIVAYFAALAAAVPLPIFVQDTNSASVSPGLARRLADTCPTVQYIKVESMPVTAKVSAMVTEAGDLLQVFGGAGGSYFIEELRRGSRGTMPFCTQPEDFVAVWQHMQAGDDAAAEAHFYRTILPVNRLAGQGAGLFYAVHKEILRRRGIIRSAFVRGPAPGLDPQTDRELAQLVDKLYPGGSA